MAETKARRHLQMCEDPACETKGTHFHHGDFQRFWESLTPEQQEWLRHKARWERMSLSAVAYEWGVGEEDRIG